MRETAAPRRVGRWSLVEEIGRGGHGAVWRAEDASGAWAAVKLLLRGGDVTPSAIRREIRTLVRLSEARPHPGLVRFLDHGLEDGAPWYAMELVAGESLDSVAAAGRPLAELLPVARRLAQALAFLHGEGFIHGDLKPANVIVREGRFPVLVDFGLVTTFGGARYRETLDSGAVPGGTPDYMAPEQCRGEPSDGRVDLYALGCILYELATGRPPFVGSRGEVLVKHLAEPPEPPSRHAPLPAALEELILALLAKGPSDRIGHADDVAVRLAALDAGPEPDEMEPPPPRAHVHRPRIVGRAAILEQVDGWLGDASAEPLLLLSGESGAGKSRVLMEVATRAREAGRTVLSGAASPEGGQALRLMSGPLQAIADRCLERGAREAERLLGPQARVIALHEPALLGIPWVAALPEPAELPARLATERLFTALLRTLDQLASRGRGLLLLLDDLQWADQLSLDFLERAAARTDAPALRLLGAHREPVSRPLLEQARGPRVRVGRLDEQAVGAMTADMLGIAAPPLALARFLESRTEGTPLFVAEYLRLAVERGLLVRDPLGRWRAGGALLASADEIALPLPTAVREVVAERLGTLSPAASAAIAIAAILGRELSEAVWRRAGSIAEGEGDDLLAELLARHVLDADERGRLRFTHDGIREQVLSALDAADARELHRSAARAIEEIHAGELGAHHAALGRHWEAAGVLGSACRHYLAAANEATRRFAHAEAERLFRACVAVSADREPEALEARQRLAIRVLLSVGRSSEALEELEAAVRMAAGSEWEATILVSLGTVQRAVSRPADSMASYARALEVARARGDSSQEALALGGLAAHRLDEGRFQEALATFQEALSVASGLEDSRAEAELMTNVALMHEALGRHDVAEDGLRRSLALSRRIGHRSQEGEILSHLASLLGGAAHFEEAAATYKQALAIHRETGNVRLEALLLWQLAEVVGRRDPEEAIACFDRAIKLARRVGDRRIEGKVLTSASDVLRGSARAGEIVGALRRSIELLDEGRDEQLSWYARASLAEEIAADGAIDEARALLEVAWRTVRAMGSAEIEALLLVMEARAELAGGSPRAALEAASRAVTLLEGATPERGLPAILTLGRARAGAGEDARAELERAEATLSLMDQAWVPASLREEHAELRRLVALGDPAGRRGQAP